MADAEARILIRAVDRVTAPIKRINAAVDRMTQPLRRVHEAAHRIGQVAGLGRLAGGLRGVGTAAAGLAGHLGGILGPLTALGGAASLAGLGQIVTGYAEAGDEVAKFARQVGVGIESLQELEYAAERQGVSQDQLRDGLKELSLQMGDLRMGTGTLHGLLKDVNPAFGTMLAGAQSNEEAFMMLMKAINSLQDPTRRSMLATAAFGEEAGILTRLAEAGADGIAELREEAQRLGIVLSEEDAAKAEAFQDSMTNLQKVMEGLRNVIGGELLLQIQPLIDSLTTWITTNRELIAQNIAALVQRIAEALRAIDWAAVQAGIQGFMDRIMSVVEFVGGWENALIALVALMNGGLIASVLDVGGAFVKLGGILLTNPVLAIIAAIALGAVAIYQNWDNIVAYFSNKFAAIKTAFSDGFLNGVVSLLVEFNPALLLADAINGMVNWLFGVDLYAVGAEFIANLGEGLQAKWQEVTAWLEDSIAGLVDWMPPWVKEKLGLDFSTEGGPTVPDAVGSPSALADRVAQVSRDAAAPAAIAGSLALAAPVAAGSALAVPTPELPVVEWSAPASPDPAVFPSGTGGSSSAFPPMPGGARTAPAPAVHNTPVTIHLTVHGQVEAEAIRKAVEAAVRQALADARDAAAADDRTSLYD